MMTRYSHLIQPGCHIIGIFPDEKSKLDAAFDFLKDGLFRSESVMIITDSMPETRIIKRMTKEWNVDAPRLVGTHDIIVKSSAEWYFEGGRPSAKKINKHWHNLVNQLGNEGKISLRVFEDTKPFFKRGFARELIHYESTLEKRFDLPLTVVCAYEYSNLETIDFTQFSALKEHHGIVWM